VAVIESSRRRCNNFWQKSGRADLGAPLSQATKAVLHLPERVTMNRKRFKLACPPLPSQEEVCK
jgi:hypothetical protein